MEEDLLVADAIALFALGEPSELWQSPSPENGTIVPFTLEDIEGLFESTGGFARGSWAVNTE
jgi:hypothetical protein